MATDNPQQQPPPSTDRTASPAPRRLAAILIAAAAFLAYWNSLRTPFVFDDVAAIRDNPSIRHLWPLWGPLSPPPDAAGAGGRPLINLSFALNYALGGLDVLGYHAFNLLAHTLTALVLFGLVRRTLARPRPTDSPAARCPPRDATAIAAGTALLWAVHPLLTESVSFIVQRNEVLVSLFYLLVLYGLVRGIVPPGDRSNARGGTRWLVLSAAACWLGMATKEVMVTAPVLALLYDRTFLAGSFREAWRLRRPLYAGLAASWLLLIWLLFDANQRGGTVGFGLGVSSWAYLVTQCRALVLYLGLSFWPHPLVLDYGIGVAPGLGAVWPQALLVVALLAATVWALARRPAAGFLGACFFVVLAPSSSVVPLTTQTMAEHRMYLPLAAIVVLATVGLRTVLGRRGLATGVALAAALGTTTVRRNADYATPVTLLTDTVVKRPENARAHGNLGIALAQEKRYSEAIDQFVEALRLMPTYPIDHYNWGLALYRLGRAQEAIDHFAFALILKPDQSEAHTNWGNCLLKLGRLDEAARHYAEAIRLRPANAEAHSNAGSMAFRLGDAAGALAHYEEALRLSPELGDAHLNYANALAQLGRTADALAHYESALRALPANPDLHYNWGVTLLNAGQAPAALIHFDEALRLHPDDPALVADLQTARLRAAGQANRP